ncbi:hypothetical protein GCM10008090_29490 [Arenicella chitinivorans]|uniref:Uncharacterized protein n=1 Tax=Arenicella chitinivorans TaxID=1329800 RepID=A0A918S068_9GAMM|nr:hypothetical protein [Arenicella chitinivorans]GHA17878.1 hypothetical protein GCM10008090_29490 [Arenicella chitinivorans]
MAAIAALTIIQPGQAAPNLQSARDLGAVTVFSDHQNPRLFYYVVANKALRERDQIPEFSYHVNRYIGKQQTGDAQTFWVRGVMKFATISDFGALSYAAVKTQLESELGHSIELLAAPIRSSHTELVYALVDAESGTGRVRINVGQGATLADDDELEAQNTRLGSRVQRFVVGLADHDANLLWENLMRENLSLSLAYGWLIPGVKQTMDDTWSSSTYQISNSLPIAVSPAEHPTLFRKTELWQRLSFVHSTLKLMCYDFVNLEDSRLYAVTVDIRFTTASGRPYTETLRFRRYDEAYERDVSFALANDLKQGFEYRVSRLSDDGVRQISHWQHANVAWLDVSLPIAELEFYQNTERDDE